MDAVWDGISALHTAAAGGFEHVVKLLLDNSHANDHYINVASSGAKTCFTPCVPLGDANTSRDSPQYVGKCNHLTVLNST